MNVTDLEIDEAIREAWTIVQVGGASPSARRLAAALLAVTGGTPTHPHWVTPDDLWRDRLGGLARQGARLAARGPRPGRPHRPGARARASQTAGCPRPCCRKTRPGARMPICCGVQPCGSAPILTARAGPRTNRDPGAGMTSNSPPLPVRGRGGENHRHPSWNPVAARSE